MKNAIFATLLTAGLLISGAASATGYGHDYEVLQLNITSPTTARATVNRATVSGTRRETVDLTVEAAAIGNITEVTTEDSRFSYETVGSAQVNYRSATTARAVVRNSNIDFNTVEVEITAEAFGNVLNVDGPTDKVDALQANKKSATTAVAVLENINLRRRVRGPGQDPIVTATAVGNTMNLGDGVGNTSTFQVNYRSPTTATARVRNVRGSLGPTTVSATAIGNSLSVNGSE